MAKRAVVLSMLVALVAVPIGRADGDPASDYLIAQRTFVPPDDGIPKAYAAQLDSAALSAKARGYLIRVALIGSQYDMGSVTVLYKQPKQYARFLGTELAPFYKGRVLVVMPNGLAVSQRGKLLAHETAVASTVPAPGTNGQALAAAGTAAVVKLAGISTPGLGSSSGGSSPIVWIVVALVLVLLLAVAVLLWVRRR